ncbi:MAG: hypothetical protein ACJ74W_05790 [Pyrinomonadaceae bacterium]
MRVEPQRSLEAEAVTQPAANDLDSFSTELQPASTLAQLPLGARLILRCRKDWRMASVAAVALDAVTLSVCSPSGHTYRVRRPAAAALTFDGNIPILSDHECAGWRITFARYDVRW